MILLILIYIFNNVTQKINRKIKTNHDNEFAVVDDVTVPITET